MIACLSPILCFGLVSTYNFLSQAALLVFSVYSAVNCWLALLLCSLSNLTTLELRDNLIRYLPTSIGNLTRLKVLDVGNNVLEELVSQVADMFSY